MSEFRRIVRGSPSITVFAVCILTGLLIDGTKAAEREMVFSAFPGSMHQSVGIPIIKEAYKNFGISVKIHLVPAKRALAASSAGVTDGEINRILKVSELYPTLLPVGGPILPLRGIVHVIGKSIKLRNWESLRPYRVGVVRGIPFSDRPTQGMNRILARNPNHMFNLLVHKRIDVAITSGLNGLYEISKYYPGKGIKALEPPVFYIDTYHFLHEKHRELIPRIAASLAQMKKSGRIAAIVDATIGAMIKDKSK